MIVFLSRNSSCGTLLARCSTPPASSVKRINHCRDSLGTPAKTGCEAHNIPSSALVRVSTCKNVYRAPQSSAPLFPCIHQSPRMRAYGTNVRAPSTFSKHRIRFYFIPIESKECLLHHMPLDRRHCLRDTTSTTPTVFGNCSYSFSRIRG